MFGRRRHQQEEEAAREAERRALFEELAKRPDTICPFLGLADARTEYRDRVSESHRCYAFGDPAELSAEQQQKVCLQRGYGNCPRYLRGVLVIPTEELEALRRPQPAPPPAAAPEPEPVAAAPGGGRRGFMAVILVLALALGGSAVAFVALSEPGGVGQQTPSPSPSPPATPTTTPLASESLVPTVTPAPTPTDEPVPSQTGLPTPGPGDEFRNHAVVVFEGQYPVYRLDEAGQVIGTFTAEFDHRSSAIVELVTGADGTRYWRTAEGGYRNLAYVWNYSGNFEIYELWESPDGERRYRKLDADEL